MSVGPEIDKRILTTGNLHTSTKCPQVSKLQPLMNVLGYILIAINDILILALSLVLAHMTIKTAAPYLRLTESIHPSLLANLWWFPILCITVLAYEGSYKRGFHFWRQIKYAVKDLTWAFILAMLFMVLSNNFTALSLYIVFLAYAYASLFLPCTRFALRRLLLSTGLWQKKVLIMGAGKTAELIISGLNRESTMGYQPIGLLEDNPKINGLINSKEYIPVLGRFSDVEQVMEQTGVRDVIIAAPGMDKQSLINLTNRLQQISANVMLVPDLFGIPLSGLKVGHLFNEKTLFLSMTNNLASAWNRFHKRTFDLIVGTTILIFIFPILIAIYLIIKLEDKGPAVFAGNRIGQNGKEFACYKFRTMYLDNESILETYLKKKPEALAEWQQYAKLKGYDPRVTKIGKILRKFSLDELPQILNVVKGEMSLVGPRPYLPREKETMGQHAEIILKTPPGITGLWQVSGRNDIDFQGRLHMDSWYVRNWSLWMDITLLIRTISVVLLRTGAY